MAKYRKRRIAEELKKEISDIIRHMKDSRLALVSVLDVRVDSELSLAKVYVSHYDGGEGGDQTLEALRGAAGHIRSELARRLKTRTVPELRFVDDHSIEAGFKITEILSEYDRNLPPRPEVPEEAAETEATKETEE